MNCPQEAGGGEMWCHGDRALVLGFLCLLCCSFPPPYLGPCCFSELYPPSTGGAAPRIHCRVSQQPRSLHTMTPPLLRPTGHRSHGSLPSTQLQHASAMGDASRGDLPCARSDSFSSPVPSGKAAVPGMPLHCPRGGVRGAGDTHATSPLSARITHSAPDESATRTALFLSTSLSAL